MPVPRHSIDWPEVHRRLAQFTLSTESGWQPEPAERHRRLRARAAALARPRVLETEGESLEVIEFLLASERYGIETVFVREVFPLAELTRLPGTPPFVLGIVNVRGEIVSVVDIRIFFDLPAAGLSDLNRLIVLERRGMVFGVLADQVLGVTRLPAQGLQGGLPTLTGIRQDYLKGIAQDRLAILDGAKLLGDPRMVVDQSAEVSERA
ncbi:MAG: purine-binding chemotaxis protein CheW [Zoogloea sp.]|nr:purine-binding chemotaxis protein CheW [Zoogloea sp.]